MTLRSLVLIAAALAAGCSWFGGGGKSESGSVSTPANAKSTKKEGKSALAEAADKLLETDRAFAAKSAEAGTAPAFSQFLDEQGMQLPAGGEPLVGRKAVTDSLAAAPTLLTWEPRYAEVFAPGNWGWTWGTWTLHEPGAGGRRVAQGKYLNLWKKQADGSWKVRLDMGNTQKEP
jgi:ketosteroid isomerase-like protein